MFCVLRECVCMFLGGVHVCSWGGVFLWYMCVFLGCVYVLRMYVCVLRVCMFLGCVCS